MLIERAAPWRLCFEFHRGPEKTFEIVAPSIQGLNVTSLSTQNFSFAKIFADEFPTKISYSPFSTIHKLLFSSQYAAESNETSTPAVFDCPGSKVTFANPASTFRGLSTEPLGGAM